MSVNEKIPMRYFLIILLLGLLLTTTVIAELFNHNKQTINHKNISDSTITLNQE
jgi:hypothetical protein